MEEVRGFSLDDAEETDNAPVEQSSTDIAPQRTKKAKLQGDSDAGDGTGPDIYLAARACTRALSPGGSSETFPLGESSRAEHRSSVPPKTRIGDDDNDENEDGRTRSRIFDTDRGRLCKCRLCDNGIHEPQYGEPLYMCSQCGKDINDLCSSCVRKSCSMCSGCTVAKQSGTTSKRMSEEGQVDNSMTQPRRRAKAADNIEGGAIPQKGSCDAVVMANALSL